MMNWKRFLAVSMTVFAMGCGGGGGGDDGGGGGNPVDPVDPGDPGDPGDGGGGTPTGEANFETSHLAQINAEQTRMGAGSGAGGVISYLNSGVRVSHDEFDGQRLAGAFDATGNNPGNSSEPTTDIAGPGTYNAGLSVGANVGVAPMADFIVTRFFRDEIPDRGQSQEDQAEALDFLLGRGDTDVLLVTHDLDANTLEPAQSRMSMGAIEQDWLIVMTTGNIPVDDPNRGSRTIALQADVEFDWGGNMIAVSATDGSGNLRADAPNATSGLDDDGPTPLVIDRFIVAPGTDECGSFSASANDPSFVCDDAPDTESDNLDEAYANGSGTTAATSLVAGAAVALRAAYPSLAGNQVVDLLLDSADDLGDPGFDSTFGHGRLNVGAAFDLAQTRFGDPGTSAAARVATAPAPAARQARTSDDPEPAPAEPKIPANAYQVESNLWMVPAGVNDTGCREFVAMSDGGGVNSLIHYQTRRGEFVMTDNGCMPIKGQ